MAKQIRNKNGIEMVFGATVRVHVTDRMIPTTEHFVQMPVSQMVTISFAGLMQELQTEGAYVYAADPRFREYTGDDGKSYIQMERVKLYTPWSERTVAT